MVAIDRESLFLSMKRLASLVSLAEDALGVERSLTTLETLPRMTQPNGGGEAVRELWAVRRRAYLQEYRATARYLGLAVHILPRTPRESHGQNNRVAQQAGGDPRVAQGQEKRDAHQPGSDPRVAHGQTAQGGDSGRG